MGFRNLSFAKVWEIQPQNERWTKIRITISKKNKETEEYETEFSSWVDCFGTEVAAKASRLKEGDRIKLLSVDVTKNYDAEKNTVYWNPKVFDFEMADSESEAAAPAPAPARKSKPASKSARAYEGENDVEDDDYPF